MDVHKRTIAVSVRFPDGRRDERTIPHEARAVNRLVRKWKREAPGAILCAYEAGPCGYGLQRELQEQGLPCQVIAPSLIPRKPEDRIKTDRRDARRRHTVMMLKRHNNPVCQGVVSHNGNEILIEYLDLMGVEKQNNIKLVIFSLLPLMVLLLLGETVVRLLSLDRPAILAGGSSVGEDFVQSDIDLGWSQKPNSRGDAGEGELFVTNSLGLRSPEVGTKKPGEFRILSLGESSTWGGVCGQ